MPVHVLEGCRRGSKTIPGPFKASCRLIGPRVGRGATGLCWLSLQPLCPLLCRWALSVHPAVSNALWALACMPVPAGTAPPPPRHCCSPSWPSCSSQVGAESAGDFGRGSRRSQGVLQKGVSCLACADFPSGRGCSLAGGPPHMADPCFSLLSPATGRQCRDLVLANPMHPDSKLTSHAKTGNSSAQPPHHNVSQGPPCNLGVKGVGAGNHGGKGGQAPPSNSGLKPTPTPGPVFGALRGKVKRERSISVDSGERQEARAASLDKELKGERAFLGWGGVGWPARMWVGAPVCPLLALGGVLPSEGLQALLSLAGEVAPRSKRRCVLERKQPYSGDEWCSGPDSEDDEKALGSSHGESSLKAALCPPPRLCRS